MVKKSLKASSRSNHSRKANKKNRQTDKHKRSKTEIKQSENYQRKAEKRLNEHSGNAATGGVRIHIEQVPEKSIDSELSNVRNVEQVKMSFNNQQLIRSLIHADDIKSEFDDQERFIYTIKRNSAVKPTNDSPQEEESIGNVNPQLFARLSQYGFERTQVVKALELFDCGDDDTTMSDCIELLWKQLIEEQESISSSSADHMQEHKSEVLKEELEVLNSIFDSRLVHNDDLTFFSIELELDGANATALRDGQTLLHIYIPTSLVYPEQSPIFLLKNDYLDSSAKRFLTQQMTNEASMLLGTQMIYSMYSWIQMNIEDKISEWKATNENAKEQDDKKDVKQKKISKNKPKSKKARSVRSSNDIKAQKQMNPHQMLQMSEQLLNDFQKKQQTETYKKMQRERSSLPVFEYRDEILEAINDNQVVLVTAETGCGKTTQVGQFILDQMLLNKMGSLCNIICTQPRRISAIGVAERVAAERDEAVGSTVGYSIQLESKRSEATRLLFCTTGVLLRLAENDPLLSDITHIIVDEVHERSLDSDFLLIVLKQLLEKRRDIKVILMSATVNAELFSDYFDCHTLFIPGRTYPIEVSYLEDVIEAVGYVCEDGSQYARSKNAQKQNQKSSDDQSAKVFDAKKYSERTLKSLAVIDEKVINYDLILKLLQHIIRVDKDDYGSILIFMPGMLEITQLYNVVLSHPTFNDKNKFVVLPLHSSLSTQNQQKIFERPKPGCRKIVISTNIAETSITIDDCTVVIDTGRMKQTQYSPHSKMSSLVECWISQANALQRSGRAGRVKAGKAFRLYTKFRYETRFRDQQVPEIYRVSLESLCLRIKALKMNGSIENVLSEAIEPPNPSAIKSSVNSLINLRALDSKEDLTPLGSHLSKLPIDVQLAKMILYAAMLQCLDPVLTIAASMGNQSPFLSPINQRDDARKAHQKLRVEKSDHLSLLKAYHKWTEALRDKKDRVFCSVNYLSNNAFLQISQRKKQFVELLAEIGFVKIKRWHNSPSKEHELDYSCNQNSHNLSMVKACLVAGLYPNVALVTEKDKEVKVLTPTNGVVHLHPSSVLFQDSLFDNKYLVYLEKVRTSKLFIRDATMVTPYSLMLFGNNLSYEKDSGQLTIDKWIKFRVDKQIAVLMDQLRIKLSMYLERLIQRQYETHQPTVSEEELEEENSLVLAISELLGTEHSIHNFENWWGTTTTTAAATTATSKPIIRVKSAH